ncbi:hypothetical protein [Heyndrickxia coagulans]|uniref:hypothetical protein n=1 Tax=Heyndrickxia coagulans TaxID=1398 RepID=UPI002235825B|nr:hypothetical protein [Heyndrickxia coagulans]UZH06064.1 hypothetical protein ONG97_14610 [Heyndrickxia coagulans]
MTLLEHADSETKWHGKNWGETVSIAYAFAKQIPFILSDESNLQSLLDQYLNSGGEKDIFVIRLRDFITGLKEKGADRKEAFGIWCQAYADQKNPNRLEWAKRFFKEQLWPIKSQP